MNKTAVRVTIRSGSVGILLIMAMFSGYKFALSYNNYDTPACKLPHGGGGSYLTVYWQDHPSYPPSGFDGRVAEFAPAARVKGVTVSGNSGQSTVFGKSYALTDVRQIAASATLPLPDADARAAAQLERGAALETLLAEVAQLRTEDAVVKRMTELGLDRAVAEDPAFCRKVAVGLMQFGSPMVSLNCKDNQ